MPVAFKNVLAAAAKARNERLRTANALIIGLVALSLFAGDAWSQAKPTLKLQGRGTRITRSVQGVNGTLQPTMNIGGQTCELVQEAVKAPAQQSGPQTGAQSPQWNQALQAKAGDAVFMYLCNKAWEFVFQSPPFDTDVFLQQNGVVLVVSGITTHHKLQVHAESYWDDECDVYWGDRTQVVKARPGSGRKVDREVDITGPGTIQVAVQNTGGKPVEVIGNWSINLTCAVSLDGRQLGTARVSGYEPRFKVWNNGTYAYQ